MNRIFSKFKYYIIGIFLLIILGITNILATDNLSLDQDTIFDNISSGSTVATISATGTGTITYSLCTTEGDDAKFGIGGDLLNELIILEDPDYISNTDGYDICIKAIDEESNEVEKSFSLELKDLTAPEFDSITVTSSNTNSGYAKSGDIITFSLNLLLLDSSANGNKLDFDLGGTGHTITFDPNTLGSVNHTIDFPILADQSGTLTISSLTFSDDNSNALSGFLSPYSLSSNIIVDNEAPIVSFLDDVEDSSNLTDIINIKATDDHIDTLEYGFSEDNNCNTFNNYDQLFDSESPFTISDKLNNGKYICVKVSDLAGNITYISSAYKLEIATVGIALSGTGINENLLTGTPVGVFSTVHSTGSDFIYTLETGGLYPDNDYFEIVESGSYEFWLKTKFGSDYETQSGYTIKVISTDSSSGVVESELHISIYDLNESPTGITITPESIDENTLSGSIFGILETLDEDTLDTHTYELLDGTGSFYIIGDTLYTQFDADFESNSGYTITVKTTETQTGGFSVPQVLNLLINDKNDSPTNLTLTGDAIDENSPKDTPVGSFSVYDQDAGATHTYQLVEGTGSEDNGSFSLSLSGILTVSGSIDYESDFNHIYSIRVRSSDLDGLYDEKQFDIIINDINESSTDVILTPNTIDENTPAGYVGTLSTVDEDVGDTFDYEFTGLVGHPNDNTMFTLTKTLTGTYISTNFVSDFEENKSPYHLLVESFDGSNHLIKDIYVYINDLNEAPTDIGFSGSLSLDEKQGIGATVLYFTTDDPEIYDSHTYELLEGTGSFELSSTGVLTTKTDFDFETQTQSGYTINVRSTDNGTGTLSYDKSFTITIEDVNQGPTALTLSGSTILENSGSGIPIGTLIGTDDGEDNGSLTYTLVTSCLTGGTDYGSFNITGSTLESIATFNYETKSTYNICVNVSDGTNNFYTNFDIYVIDENETPTKINLSNESIKENSGIGSEVGIFTTEDPDGVSDTHTYELITSTGDYDKFTLSNTGLLTINNDFDFENDEQSYNISVKSIDKLGLFKETAFTITIEDVNQGPTALTLSGTGILENRGAGVTIGTFSGSDDGEDNGSLTYTGSTGCATGYTDNGKFNIIGSTLESNAIFDFEDKSIYTICVSVSDGLNSIDRNFDINILDVNDAPEDIILSSEYIDENLGTGATVGFFTTEDQDSGDSHTYELLEGTGSFELSSTGVLKTNFDGDFEDKPFYTILVRSSDGGLFKDKSFTIGINDLNTPPSDLTLSGSTILENIFVGTTIGTFTGEDDGEDDGTLSYTLTGTCSTGGKDNTMFNIVGDNLKTITPINFESGSTLSICVNVSDGLNSLTKDFNINIGNVNESPYNFIFSQNIFEENTVNPFIVGNLSSQDEDAGDLHTYDFENTGIGSIDNPSFDLSSTGVLTSKFIPDFETQSLYQVKFKVTDSGGITSDLQKTIIVDDVNEEPTLINLSGTSIDENIGTGALVGVFDTTDQDKGDSHTYTFVSGIGSADNDDFRIVGNALISDFSGDFETKPSYSIRIRSTDGDGLYIEDVFTISIGDVDETGFTISLSGSTLLENTAIGTTVGKLSTISSNTGSTRYSYTLLEGTGSFEIDGDDIKSKISPNFESGSIYNISVLSEDNLGHTGSRDFTINILNENENPISLSLSGTTIDENTMGINIVGTFTTSDTDLNDTHIYNLVQGTGSNDNTGFTIIGNTLLSSFTSDFETKEFYYVRVRSTDAGGSKIEDQFTIRIINLPENPTDISYSGSLAIDENVASGVTLGSFSTAGTNTGATYTYTLSGAVGDNDSFTISGDDLVTNFVGDYEDKNYYDILVRTTDDLGYFFEESFRIDINNKNELPTDITLTSNSVFENTATGTTVGTLSTLLFDFGDTYNYGFATGSGDTDNNLFDIIGSNLVTNYVFDREIKDNYTVRIISTDTGSLTTEKSFTINILDKNTQPTDIALSGTGIDENLPTGTLIGNLTGTDDGEDTGLTFDLCATGGVNNDKFTITGSILSGYTLQSNKTFDYEIDGQNQNICITVDDGSLSYNKDFVIGVNNLVENPTNIIFSGSQVIPENTASGTTLGSFTSVGVNVGVTYNYTLSGSDSSFFSISAGNNLVIDFVPNYEDRLNTPYNIWVNTTDTYSGTFDKQFQFTISDENTRPTDIALTGTGIDENSPSETFIGTFSGTDDGENQGTLSYSLNCATGGVDNDKFTITGSTLSGYTLLSNGGFDFENKPTYDICVELSDGDLTYTESFIISVNDLNDNPTDIDLIPSVLNEGMLTGTTVGDFSTTDQDGGSHTYTLATGSGDDDNTSFTITGSTLKTNFLVDFEDKSSFKIRVKSTDNGSGFLSTEKEFILTVNNTNNAPTDITLSGSTIDENLPALTFIGDLSGTDDGEDDGTLDYSFCATGGVDNNDFTLTGSTLSGYKLLSNRIFDYENDASYNVCIRLTDGAYFYDKIFTILINNVIEAPTDIIFSGSLSLDENTPSGYNMGDFNTLGTNSGVTYSYALVDGTGDTDNISFTIFSGSTSLVTNFVPNYITKSSYSIRVRSTDSLSSQIERPFIININDLNNAPTDIALSNNYINENQSIGTTIGTLTGTDDGKNNNTLTYSLNCTNTGVNDGSFSIAGTTLNSNSVFDYETKNTYNICIRVSDGDLTYDENFVIAVNDLAETGADISFSGSLNLNENNISGINLGDFITTGSSSGATTYIYTLVAGTGSADNASFTLSLSGTLTATFISNYETKNTYSILVRSTDDLGGIVEKQFSVIISDVNENPTDISINNSNINENLGAGATVGTFTTIDVDTSNTFTYTLVSGTGSDNNGSFGISGGNLVANFSADYESKNSYTVRVRTTDNGLLFTEKQFTVSINNINESTGGGGGGGSGLIKDSCPVGEDYSPSYYDKTCGTKPKTGTGTTTSTGTTSTGTTSTGSTTSTITGSSFSDNIDKIIDKTFEEIIYEDDKGNDYIIQKTKTGKYLLKKSDGTYENKVFPTIKKAKEYADIIGDQVKIVLDDYDFNESFKPVVYVSRYGDRFIVKKLTNGKYLLYTENGMKLNGLFSKQYEIMQYLQRVFGKNAFIQSKHTS